VCWNDASEEFVHLPFRSQATTDSDQGQLSVNVPDPNLQLRTVSSARLARDVLWQYGIGLLSVAAAFISTLSIQRLFPYPFLFLFFGAVMVSGWFGGMGAGIFAVLLSTVVVDYFFLPPFYSFSVSTTAEAYFGVFVACALVASWLSASKRHSEEALKEARDELEIRVSERTAELMKTQGDLAHLSQVLSMGELTASIAHEINQPLTAVVTHGHACVEWLSANPPKFDKALLTAHRIIEDGTRAGAVLGRIRALFKKEAIAREWVDINEVIRELNVFLRDEASRRGISMRTDLASNLPRVIADRVQLQQVVLNLIMNGFDAMDGAASRAKELAITSQSDGATEILVQVKDSGVGLNPETADKIFDPFFTTKSQGIGMGLAISRTIIESHEGRLWASPSRKGEGAVFQFTLPVRPKSSA
jgi:C4-dicarboxylate-specific signal transduction histidine kinase